MNIHEPTDDLRGTRWIGIQRKVITFHHMHTYRGSRPHDVLHVPIGDDAIMAASQTENRPWTGAKLLTSVHGQYGPDPARHHSGVDPSPRLAFVAPQLTARSLSKPEWKTSARAYGPNHRRDRGKSETNVLRAWRT